MGITREQRFTDDHPCPICRNTERDPRGKNRRCHGFISTDEQYVFCARVQSDYPDNTGQLYKHKRYGQCYCGAIHAPDNRPTPIQPSRVSQVYNDPLPPISGEWFYHDESGQRVLRVTRHERGEKKEYHPWHYAGRKWKMGQGEIPCYLYRLPHILKSSQDTPIYIVEGEKCAGYLANAGLESTTNLYGAGKWHLTANRHEPLRGHPVIILPDNDKPGYTHASQIANDLHGIAKSIKIVALPGLPEKGDIADWLESGHTTRELADLIDRADIWTPDNTQPEMDNEDSDNQEEKQRYHFLTIADLYKLPKIKWLIYDCLPQATMSFVVGEERSGKSFLVLDWGLCVASGVPWMGRAVEQGAVVYVAGEGLSGIAKRIKAWTIKNQVTPEHFYALGEAVPLLQPESVRDLIASIQSLPVTPKLIIIDTLARAIVGGDENSAKDIGLAIAAADVLKTTFQSHVLIVHHKNKTGGVRGSNSMTGATDVHIDVVKDGSLVTVTCPKQKDFPEFSPIHLLLKPLVLDEYGEETSCVLQSSQEIPATFLTDSQRKALVALSQFTSGAKATEWKDATGLPERTFYDARAQLEVRHLIFKRTQGYSEKYNLSDAGKKLLQTDEKNSTAMNENCTAKDTAKTSSAVRPQSVAVGVYYSPPIGGDNNPPATAVHASPAGPTEGKNTILSFPSVKPTDPCQKCGRVAWYPLSDYFGGEDYICGVCNPDMI